VVEITIRPARRFAARGPASDRVELFVQSLVQAWGLRSTPACEVEATAPPQHVGLGVGTQLGLSVAAGLRRFLDLPEITVEQLAVDVGRGARSAVGTYGFQYGGLIVDAGKMSGQRLGALVRQMTLPADWRIVLVNAGAAPGLAGETEADAFARLPPVGEEVTRALWRITEEEMLPAIASSDCGAFGDAVYRYGRTAGECFAAVQDGAFAGSKISDLVESIRAQGIAGVGQSSWGPTVFAFMADDAEALALVRWLRNRTGAAESDITIALPSGTGAQISTL
jgi:beta-RFAP synthase